MHSERFNTVHDLILDVKPLCKLCNRGQLMVTLEDKKFWTFIQEEDLNSPSQMAARNFEESCRPVMTGKSRSQQGRATARVKYKWMSDDICSATHTTKPWPTRQVSFVASRAKNLLEVAHAELYPNSGILASLSIPLAGPILRCFSDVQDNAESPQHA